MLTRRIPILTGKQAKRKVSDTHNTYHLRTRHLVSFYADNTCAIYIAAMWNQSVFSFGNYAEEGVPIPNLLNFGQVVSLE